MHEERTFASSRKVSRDKALACFRLLAPDADEEILDSKAWRTWPQYWYVWSGSYVPWCKANGLAAIPVDAKDGPVVLPPAQLKGYVKHLRAEDKAAASIDAYVAAVATTLRLNGVDLDRIYVDELLKAYRDRSGPPRRARALIGEELQRLVERLDPETARDCRDATLFLLGYAAASRGSELVGLDLGRSGGTAYGCTGVLAVERRGYRVTLYRSKRRRTPGEIVIPFMEMPSLKVWLDRWIRHARIAPGEPIFRAIERWGHVQPARLAPDAVSKILKVRMLEYTRATGLPDKEAGILARQYTSHSMRRGYCSTASEKGLSLGQIRKRSRHCSDAVLGAYIRDAEDWRSSGLGEGVGF